MKLPNGQVILSPPHINIGQSQKELPIHLFDFLLEKIRVMFAKLEIKVFYAESDEITRFPVHSQKGGPALTIRFSKPYIWVLYAQYCIFIHMFPVYAAHISV
jgi:hypothetical protein